MTEAGPSTAMPPPRPPDPPAPSAAPAATQAKPHKAKAGKTQKRAAAAAAAAQQEQNLNATQHYATRALCCHGHQENRHGDTEVLRDGNQRNAF
jgi:hypothetical protein